MRKELLVILGISGLLLVGCHTVPNAAQETNTIVPTGYASEEVQRISLFYDGSVSLENRARRSRRQSCRSGEMRWLIQ